MRKAPIVTGQCAQVLTLIRQYQPLPSFVLTADHAIPEAAARVHDLRAKGYHVITQIVPEVEFRGRIRRNVALYSLGVPEWPSPDFLAGERRQ
ncbi:MAG: helix-turn-helix domain-containing protein [Saprospiraceae bacterium]|nr:helix-turn-helix domain-containing protein [Saprospiraceae bacterium]